MRTFKVINTNFNNLSDYLTNKELANLRAQIKIAGTSQNVSIAQTIEITFTDPDYTFSRHGLQYLLDGLLYPTINDYTGGSVEGRLILPFADNAQGAAQIIGQLRLTTETPISVLFINRQLSGGDTPLNIGTFVGSSNYIKFARNVSGILSNDADSIQIWESSDNSDRGFYIYVQGLNFERGKEAVRLIASQQAPPLVEATCCRYNSVATFDKLDFIQTLHPEYSLNAWCYFGRLTGNSGVYALTFLIQKTIPFTLPYMHHKLEYDIAGGFNSASLAKWQLDGCGSSSGPIIKSNPWSTSATCNDGAIPADLTSLLVQQVSGNVGEKNTSYKLRLEAIIGLDFHVNPVYIEVEFTDLLGTVNEGFGPDAFLPNWLTPEQRDDILNMFGGSVANYLASGKDDMACQGSYYFSQPLLSVTDFTIFDLDGTILDTKAAGNDSVIWFDYVAQSFNTAGLQIVNNIGWEFFAIQFPTEKMALMITRITSPTVGVYQLANLFTENDPTVRWNINDINIVGSNIWTSPTSGKDYYTTYTITLSNPSVSIIVQTDWDEQEISVGGQTKYEGICTVTGTVLGSGVSGFSWIEQQALN